MQYLRYTYVSSKGYAFYWKYKLNGACWILSDLLYLLPLPHAQEMVPCGDKSSYPLPPRELNTEQQEQKK